MPESLLAGGQILLTDRLLMLLEPRNMRVAEHCNAVGVLRGGECRRFHDMINRLARQAIHQVDIERRNVTCSESVYSCFDRIARLGAIDPFLDAGVEHLDAEAGAREAVSGQGSYHCGIGPARIQLGRNICKRADGKPAVKDVKQTGDLIR